MHLWKFTNGECLTIENPNWIHLLDDKSTIFWLDLSTDDPAAPKILHEVFRFHPLAMEDTFNERQRPKVEEYEDHLFGILNAVELKDGELEFREVDVFLGANFLVTVHDDQREKMIDEVLHRVNKRGMFKLPMSPGYLLYSLVDTMVDSYFPILDVIGDTIDLYSEEILVNPKQEQLKELFKLKRSLAEMWRVVGQQRDMFLVLTREGSPFINQDVLRYYLRDVYDHLIRVSDTVNTFRDTLSNVIDLYLSSVSNRLNVIVRRLTVITIGSSVLAVITGFYGMNFDTTFPPFSADWGVPFVIGLMIVAIAIVAFIFGRQE